MRWGLRKNKAGFSGRWAGQQGFTLVEIMVVAAIIAIMAGLMVPLFGSIWEGNERSETRQKMAELKRAMVGDQRLVQNGIRMHYGFVGDNGDLPEFIADVAIDQETFANWHGPYLVGAFDMKDYYNDAWHRELKYTRYPPGDPLPVVYEVQGHPDVTLYFAATLTSLGFDGLAGTDDDIDVKSNPELQIMVSEVWPTTKVQGNLDYVVTAGATISPPLSAKLYVTYNVPTGTDTLFSNCLDLDAGEVVAGEPKRVHQQISLGDGLSPILPVGRVIAGSRLYANSTCTEPPVVSSGHEVAAYISDGLATLTVNLPTLNYAVP